MPLSGAFLDASRDGVPERLLGTPTWLFHGNNDNVVDVETSRSVFRTLAGLGPSDPIVFTDQIAEGGSARYTETSGGHNIWTAIYGSDTVYDWLFAQRLIPEPGTGALLLTAAAAWPLARVRRG